jgi:anti-sigma B factor antagonist
MFEMKRIDPETIILSGRFDSSQSEKAMAFLGQLNTSTTLDLSALDYISSTGLGVLIAIHQQLKERGAQLTLTNLNNHVRLVVQLARLDLVLHIV